MRKEEEGGGRGGTQVPSQIQSSSLNFPPECFHLLSLRYISATCFQTCLPQVILVYTHISRIEDVIATKPKQHQHQDTVCIKDLVPHLNEFPWVSMHSS